MFLPSALKLDVLATDTVCEGDAAPLCVLPDGRWDCHAERPFGPLHLTKNTRPP